MTQAYLIEYRDRRRDLGWLTDQLEALKNTSVSAPRLTGTPTAHSGGSPVEQIILRAEALAEKYKAELAALLAMREEIEAAIEDLDPAEKSVIRLRYLDGESWAFVERSIGYEWAQTHRIHARALEKIRNK